MPKHARPTKFAKFANEKKARTVVTTVLLTAGLGGALGVSPDHPRTAGSLAQPAVSDAATVVTAPIAPQPVPAAAPAPAPAPAPEPVVVAVDSSPQDIVKAIVSQGRAAGLAEEQIKTVIATAKIESSFRPTVSGGMQPYGSAGTHADEVVGLFQEKASFGTTAERQDPNLAIARFISRYTEAFRKYGISGDPVQAATLAQNPQLLRIRRGVGTGYYNTVQAAMGEADDLYNQAAAPPSPIVLR